MKTRDHEVDVVAAPGVLPPAPPAPEVTTVEEWARRKGMLARFLAGSAMFTEPNPAYQDWAQARAHAGWVEGVELTEAQFDAAVAAAKSPTFR